LGQLQENERGIGDALKDLKDRISKLEQDMDTLRSKVDAMKPTQLPSEPVAILKGHVNVRCKGCKDDFSPSKLSITVSAEGEGKISILPVSLQGQWELPLQKGFSYVITPTAPTNYYFADIQMPSEGLWEVVRNEITDWPEAIHSKRPIPEGELRQDITITVGEVPAIPITITLPISGTYTQNKPRWSVPLYGSKREGDGTGEVLVYGVAKINESTWKLACCDEKGFFWGEQEAISVQQDLEKLPAVFLPEGWHTESGNPRCPTEKCDEVGGLGVVFSNGKTSLTWDLGEVSPGWFALEAWGVTEQQRGETGQSEFQVVAVKKDDKEIPVPRYSQASMVSFPQRGGFVPIGTYTYYTYYLKSETHLKVRVKLPPSEGVALVRLLRGE